MSRRRDGLTVGVDARSLLCQEPRGEGKSLLRLYQEMVDLDPALRLIFFGDERGRNYAGPLPARTSVRLLSSRGSRFDAWENVQLPVAALVHRCDVVHCASSGGPRWCGVPTVLTVHDLIPMLLDDGQSEMESRSFRKRLRRGLAHASAVIAVSAHTRSDLVRCFPGNAEKTRVVYWGKPNPPSGVLATPDAAYVLAFGGAARRKNTDYTVQRFAAAAQRVPGLRLWLVGVGSAAQREHVLRLADQLGVGHRLSLPGFVSEVELHRLLANACLLLYLSTYEGFGLPLVEAVAHGVPVIASDTSSIPEVLNDGRSCHSLADEAGIEAEIVRIATDRHYRAGRLHAQTTAIARFDWRDTARQTHALLRNAAAA